MTAREHAEQAAILLESAGSVHPDTGRPRYSTGVVGVMVGQAQAHALTAIALSFAAEPAGTIGERLDWLTEAVRR